MAKAKKSSAQKVNKDPSKVKSKDGEIDTGGLESGMTPRQSNDDSNAAGSMGSNEKNKAVKNKQKSDYSIAGKLRKFQK